LGERVAALQAAYPHAQVELWAQDEHRLGLKPILRRVWSPRGVRPVVAVRPRYEWLWVYGWVHPATGATEWLLLPTVNTALFTLALEQFAQAVGAGPNKQVLVALDQAGWHVAAGVRLPAGVHLEFLPAYSPELQPAERLWPLTNEGVANRLFATLDALEEALVERLGTLMAQPELVRAYTAYHWWPKAGCMLTT
jgi:DDE superfamily endonuclease